MIKMDGKINNKLLTFLKDNKIFDMPENAVLNKIQDKKYPNVYYLFLHRYDMDDLFSENAHYSFCVGSVDIKKEQFIDIDFAFLDAFLDKEGEDVIKSLLINVPKGIDCYTRFCALENIDPKVIEKKLIEAINEQEANFISESDLDADEFLEFLSEFDPAEFCEEYQDIKNVIKDMLDYSEIEDFLNEYDDYQDIIDFYNDQDDFIDDYIENVIDENEDILSQYFQTKCFIDNYYKGYDENKYKDRRNALNDILKEYKSFDVNYYDAHGNLQTIKVKNNNLEQNYLKSFDALCISSYRYIHMSQIENIQFRKKDIYNNNNYNDIEIDKHDILNMYMADCAIPAQYFDDTKKVEMLLALDRCTIERIPSDSPVFKDYDWVISIIKSDPVYYMPYFLSNTKIFEDVKFINKIVSDNFPSLIEHSATVFNEFCEVIQPHFLNKVSNIEKIFDNIPDIFHNTLISHIDTELLNDKVILPVLEKSQTLSADNLSRIYNTEIFEKVWEKSTSRVTLPLDYFHQRILDNDMFLLYILNEREFKEQIYCPMSKKTISIIKYKNEDELFINALAKYIDTSDIDVFVDAADIDKKDKDRIFELCCQNISFTTLLNNDDYMTYFLTAASEIENYTIDEAEHLHINTFYGDFIFALNDKLNKLALTRFVDHYCNSVPLFFEDKKINILCSAMVEELQEKFPELRKFDNLTDIYNDKKNKDKVVECSER